MKRFGWLAALAGAAVCSVHAADVDDRTLGAWTNYLNSKTSFNGPHDSNLGWKKNRGASALVEEDLRKQYFRAVDSGDVDLQEKLAGNLLTISPDNPEYREWVRQATARKLGIPAEGAESAANLPEVAGVKIGRMTLSRGGDLYRWEVRRAPARLQTRFLQEVEKLRLSSTDAAKITVETREDGTGKWFTAEPLTMAQVGRLTGAWLALFPKEEDAPSPNVSSLHKKPAAQEKSQRFAELVRKGKGKGSGDAEGEPTYTFSVKGMPVEDALALFGKLNRLNILPDPEVSGNVTVDFRGLTLSDALDAILENLGCYAEEQGGLIRVRAFETKIFKVDYLLISRTMTRKSGASGSDVASSASSSNDSTEVESKMSLDFWKMLFGQLQNLLSKETPEQELARKLRQYKMAVEAQQTISLQAALRRQEAQLNFMEQIRLKGFTPEQAQAGLTGEVPDKETLQFLSNLAGGTNAVGGGAGGGAGGMAGGAGAAAGRTAGAQSGNQAAGQSSAQSGGAAAGGGFSQQVQDREQVTKEDENVFIAEYPNGVRLIVNPLAGTVLVRDRKPNLEKVGEYLELMRSRVERQVDLDVQVYSVEFTDDRLFAVNWDRVQAYVGQTAWLASGNLTPAALNTQNNSFLTPFTLSFNRTNMAGVIRAIEDQGKLKVLSKPRIRTMNQQAAHIKVIRTDPFFVSESDVTQSQSGNIVTQNVTVNNVSTGTFVSITPQIADDGSVTLDIMPVVSTLLGTAEFVQNQPNPAGGSVPVTNATAPRLEVKQATSVVRVKDGDTVVMGGFINDQKQEGRKKIPVLGDIPLVGTLFTGMDDVSVRSELLIFVSPTVVMPTRTLPDVPVAKN